MPSHSCWLTSGAPYRRSRFTVIERLIGPLSRTIRASRPGRSPLIHKAARWIRLCHAETQRWTALAFTGVDEVDHEPTANPFVPTRRDDCDRQFGDIFGDKAVAMARLGVRPIPNRAHRCVLFCNQSMIARSRPSSEVHRIARIGEHLVTGRRWLVRSPDCGLAKHLRQKGEVLGPCRPILNVPHVQQFGRRFARAKALPDPPACAPLARSRLPHTAGPGAILVRCQSRTDGGRRSPTSRSTVFTQRHSRRAGSEIGEPP